MDRRVAVVSGGTKGIGAAVVERLRKDGWTVVTGSRSAEPEHGDDLTVVRADLGTPDGVATLAAAARDRGRVEALVNNVGQADVHSSFLDVTDTRWEQSFAVNLLSAVRLTRALLPTLLDGGGAVVNVSSINARVPFPLVVDYSVFKAALSNLTQALSEEFAPRGVRVNTVSPGPVRTPAWTEDGGLADTMAAATGATRAQLLGPEGAAGAGVALGRMGEADEVAGAVAFLLGPDARWITGTDLVVDGGTLKAA